MRPTLQRLLASPLAIKPFRHFGPNTSASIKSAYRDGESSRRSSAVAGKLGEGHAGRLSDPSEFTASKETKEIAAPERVLSFRGGKLGNERDRQFKDAGSPDQNGERTNIPQLDYTHFTDYEKDVTSWFEVLEMVRARRRYGQAHHAEMLYKKIVENELDLPTKGDVATELWDHFIQVSNKNSDSLLIAAKYAIELQQRTGRAPVRLYGRLMEQDLVWHSSYLALSLHQILKADFPPTSTDYGNLLQILLRRGKKPMAIFQSVYKDFAVPSMYPVVVPKLCMLGMHTEAVEWHHLLLTNDDLPKSFRDCKSLLEYYAHVKNDKTVEALVRSLAQRQIWFEKDVNQFVRNDNVVSREIMNRTLGEVHGIAPKTLSDDFCARIFATKLFSLDLVISGLQAIGVQTLGSSSLRELVVRDEYSCEDVVYHLNKLEEAGINVLPSRFNSMIRKAAFRGESKLLKSIAETDLHPDTFEDINLQERLLATYCEKGDLAQMERTLAIIESTVPKKSLKMQRVNLLLRCHVSVGNRVKVHSILESMQRNQLPLTRSSSRHLRRAYLSPRRKGVRPCENDDQVQDLALIINVMKMTLESGAFIPIVSWREILRRLGMMGQLARYKNLALWIVDWYTRMPEYKLTRPGELSDIQSDRLLATTTQPLLDPAKVTDRASLTLPLAPKNNTCFQRNDLLILFGKEAQQGIIAWGFQAEVKQRPVRPQSGTSQTFNSSPHWPWGLKLLKELQGRGVLIDTAAVAKACRHRLAQLFNHSTISKKGKNRRAKKLNDSRSVSMPEYRYSAYVRGMEEIWGRDLFQSWDRSLAPLDIGEHAYHGSTKGKWRIFEHERRTDHQIK